MLWERGSPTSSLTTDDLREGVFSALELLEGKGARKKVMLLPPDYTRLHSRTGELVQLVYEFYGDKVTDIMPALGTHRPMTEEQITDMFGSDIPIEAFKVHDWRNDVVTVGEVSAAMVRAASDGHVDEPWPAQLNKLVVEGGHDLILSLGQVVPHEVLGMANYNKNLFIGVGGAESINFSHFIGATYGMERMMGRANNPLRQILNTATRDFIDGKLPVAYMHTVVGRDDDGELLIRGLFISEEADCFTKAAELSLEVNFNMLNAPLPKCVVYLDPEEYKSTWLGNKSIYRTRMAIADGGELVIMAPGVDTFGEDPEIDALIRKYGYRTTPETLEQLNSGRDLMKNLSAAAHLIHGSSEGRFKVTYCPGHLSREEVEGAGFGFGDVEAMLARYDPSKLTPGPNSIPGGEGEEPEEIYFVPNPGLGLWAYRGRFEASEASEAPEGDRAAAEDGDAAEATAFSSQQDPTAPSVDVGVGGPK
mmetsp:Transcript_15963/g.29017  ORF Transcript_15963/g.29017 Transcript_15963/m.29017 type:complete len:478 (+) Transcript_15963:473-1906(+)